MENIKQTKKQLFWEIFRYLLVGGIATIFDYAVWYVIFTWVLPSNLIGETWSVIISTAMGFATGLLVNWLLSITFVFKQVSDKENAKSSKSFLIFVIVGLIGLAITEVGMLVAGALPSFTLFGVTEFLSHQWKWWFSKVAMTCIVLVWNYVGRKVLIFK
jgi:putative flippase GtrA